MRTLFRRVIALVTGSAALTALLVAAAGPASSEEGWPHRFYWNTICVEDRSYGAYPAYFHTATNVYDSAEIFGATYTKVRGGCSYGYAANRQVQARLVPASHAYAFDWCAAWSGKVNKNNYWITTVKVYFNYYRADCRDDGPTEIGHAISSVLGEAIGLNHLYFADRSYRVMNTSRWDIKWPTRYDLGDLERRYSRPGIGVAAGVASAPDASAEGTPVFGTIGPDGLVTSE